MKTHAAYLHSSRPRQLARTVLCLIACQLPQPNRALAACTFDDARRKYIRYFVEHHHLAPEWMQDHWRRHELAAAIAWLDALPRIGAPQLQLQIITARNHLTAALATLDRAAQLQQEAA